MSGMSVLLLAMLQLPGPALAQDSTLVGKLEGAMRRYSEVIGRGGWPRVPPGSRIDPDGRDPRVPVLRKRLALEGFWVDSSSDSDWYDPNLQGAVRRFQELHGLAPDAVIGPATMAALNLPPESRVGQIAANLARERTLPPLGDRYVLVNIPAFTLELVDSGRSIIQARVIVGRPDWPTPTFHSRIDQVVFRPLWRVPRSIAIQEILPLARKDPGYFERTGMGVFESAAREGRPVDPDRVDWSAVSARGFHYALVQEPGPANPLGGAKLVMKSPYDVYLHDTPAQTLFERPRRTLSHGCVRVEHIVRVIEYLLPHWPPDSVRGAMEAGRDRRIPIPVPIQIHLVYRTAWVEADGLVAFRDDVYRLDRKR